MRTKNYLFVFLLMAIMLTTFAMSAPNISVTIKSPTATTYITSSISFNVATNVNSTCKYSLNGGLSNVSLTANATATGFTGTNATIADGSYTCNAYCTNVTEFNNSVSVAFVKDTTFYVTIANPSATTWFTGTDIPIGINLQEDGNCTYSLNAGVTNKTFTENHTGFTFRATEATLTDGVYNINFYCADLAGNKNNPTEAFTIDTINAHSTALYQVIASSGGGLALLIIYFAKSIPVLLIVLSIVGIIVVIGLGISKVLKAFDGFSGKGLGKVKY